MDINAPRSKRLKLNRVEGSQQDEAEWYSDSLSETHADQFLSASGKIPSVLIRESDTSTSSVKVSDMAAMLDGDVHISSMFNLQVEEMLHTVRLNYARVAGPVDKALNRLKFLIENIKNREPLTIAEAIKFMHKTHKITIPFPETDHAKEVTLRLAYSSPSEVNVMGSYALRTMVKSSHTLAVDMVVTLPSSILRDKDYLNYRYFYKRAYYLACLAAGLQDGGADEFEICFDYLGGNTLQPILVVKPVGDSGFSASKCLIRIIPAAPQDFFDEAKLRPDRNAIRPKTVSGFGNSSLAPTPFYNATVRAESTVKNYLNLLHRSSKHTKSFQDACLLGKIWLRQRGFGGTISAGGFGHFEWATLCALLLQGNGPKSQSILSPGYSSYQLFKAVIQYLSTTNLIANPVLFQAPAVTLTRTNFPIFYDGPRGHNILFKMTLWSYAKLLDEAKISIEMFAKSPFDEFEATFIFRKDYPFQEFDFSFQLPNSAIVEESTSPDHGDQMARVCFKTYSVLAEGLNNRVKIIYLKIPETIPWSLKTKPTLSASGIFVGIVFDPANIGRLVDHGPAVDDKKSAAQYRKFWGEKAELRRFKDGNILESVVWSSTSDVSMLEEIVIYLLNRHIGDEIGQHIQSMHHNFSRLFTGFDNNMKAFDNLKAAFHTLEQDIRAIVTLPLQPKSMSNISPQLRFSSVMQPNFSPQKYLREAAEILIQFEDSGRWPDDFSALQQTKLAFLLKIGNILATTIPGVNTRLLLENTDRALSNCGVLDIMYPSGAVFRLRMYVDREQYFLERLIKEKSTNIRTLEDAIFARSHSTYTSIKLPLHSQSVAMHCTRYPALSSSIRLVKRWFASHMLAGHVSEELIELLVIHTFLRPYPWRTPSSASMGLLRTLYFLSRWDWRVTPLIVDFNGSVTNEDVVTVKARLEAWRNIDPGMTRMVLLAATSYDMTGTAFTDGRPSKVIAARMTALARSACLSAKNQALNLNMETLFRSSFNDYDFVIHISPKFASNRLERPHPHTTKFRNLEIQTEEDLSLAGFEPVSLFLAELQQLYTKSVVLFYDPLSRLAIGGLWNPQLNSRVFKTNLAHSSKPILGSLHGSQHLEIEIDRAAILSEIARLGGDMVARIDTCR